MRLKPVHMSNRTKFFWKSSRALRRCCHIEALASNVVFDRTADIESKILPEDLRLYKDDLNVSKSHRYLLRGKAVNCFERNKQYLKRIRALTGSQCRPRRRGEMWRNLGALQTSLAELEAFKTLYNLLSW